MAETIALPRRVGGRGRAARLVASLAPDLSGTEVVVDWRRTDAASPTFVDELIRACLVERGAASVRFVAPLQRTAEYARRSAQRRDVVSSLIVDDVRTSAD